MIPIVGSKFNTFIIVTYYTVDSIERYSLDHPFLLIYIILISKIDQWKFGNYNISQMCRRRAHIKLHFCKSVVNLSAVYNSKNVYYNHQRCERGSWSVYMVCGTRRFGIFQSLFVRCSSYTRLFFNTISFVH